MFPEKIGIKIWDLKSEARDEVYTYIDKYYQKLPRNLDGSIRSIDPSYNDNEIDSLRHAYVSAVYLIEFGAETAELLGRLNEFDPSSTEIRSKNMDLWNNSVGRNYGKKFKRGEELFFALIKALKNGELITTPNDLRKYKGAKVIIRMPKAFVVKVKESRTGANIEFFDIRNKKLMTKEEFIKLIKAGKYPGYAIRKHNDGEFPYSTRDRFSFNNLG